MPALHGSLALAAVAVVMALATGCGGHVRAATQPPTVSQLERPEGRGFYALWKWPKAARHQTTIVLLGGSDGGTVHTDLVSALVAHGYPVLDLAYFREPGLPKKLERIRLEYFRRALEWLAAQPQVDPRRVVTFGISRGGELSLILAATFPTLVHGAVEYVGGWFVGGGLPDPSQPAWTYHGKPVFNWPVTGVIPVWKINGPIFATGGGDDTLARSAQSVQTIVNEMHQHGRKNVTGLIYPDAGHLLGLVLPVHYRTTAATHTASSTSGQGKISTSAALQKPTSPLARTPGRSCSHSSATSSGNIPDHSRSRVPCSESASGYSSPSQ